VDVNKVEKYIQLQKITTSPLRNLLLLQPWIYQDVQLEEPELTGRGVVAGTGGGRRT
jgi:hypothetical protein